MVQFKSDDLFGVPILQNVSFSLFYACGITESCIGYVYLFACCLTERASMRFQMCRLMSSYTAFMQPVDSPPHKIVGTELAVEESADAANNAMTGDSQ